MPCLLNSRRMSQARVDGDQLISVDNPAEKTHANDLRAMPEVYRPTTAVCLTAPTQHQPSKEAVTP